MVQKERGIMMSDIENEADWTAYGMKLQKAVSHNNEKSFQRALNEARNIYEKIRNKGESRIKSRCRNVMAEAYQGMEQFEEAAILIRENLEYHSNNIQALILQMRDTLHGKRYSEIRKAGLKAEDLMARYGKQIEGDFMGESFRNQIIDVMNATYQIKNIPINVEYTDTRRKLILDFLPPEPKDIISNTAIEREGVDISPTGAFYNTDKPGSPNSLNNIVRLETSINYKRKELLKDPKRIDEIMKIIRD
jgi:hypothetical protein